MGFLTSDCKAFAVSYCESCRTFNAYIVVESLSVAADRAINSNHLDLMDVQLEASIPLAPAHAR